MLSLSVLIPSRDGPGKRQPISNGPSLGTRGSLAALYDLTNWSQ
nr:MAG TPA: hypothetical protein [Siphoviridae sp. ctnoo6]